MCTKNVFIEKSLDGLDIVKAVKDDKAVYLGSKYNMQREIEKFLAQLDDEKIDTIFVFGLGTGEHIKKLLSKNIVAKVYVFEPDEDIFEKVKNSQICDEIFNTDGVYVRKYDKNEFEVLIDNIITEANLEYFKIMSFANYGFVFGKEYKDFLSTIKKKVVHTRINKNTKFVFSELWFDIFVRNMLNLKNAVCVNSLKNMYKGKTAVIVSAGPSLEKNVHLLKGKEDGLIIITGGRTLGTLLKYEIKPDFLCVVDPVEKTYKLMEKFLYLDVPLIFYEGTNADVVEKYKGKKIFYAKESFVKYFLGRDIDTLLSGGSVAVTCLGLAIYLGCKNIIFIGQDLAFTNDKLHASNAILESEKNEVKKETIFVKGIDGNPVKTDYSLNMFRETIESIIQVYSEHNYINATEGGAHIEGTKVMRLEEAISEFYCSDLRKKELDLQPDEFDYDFIYEKLSNALNDFKVIQDKCKEGMRIVRNIREESFLINTSLKKKITSKLRKLDSIDDEIKKRFENNGFSNLILYPVTMAILSDIENTVLESDPEEIKLEKALNRSHNMYESIYNKLDVAIRILENRLNAGGSFSNDR
ncbi:DUF115 domain-containing protein [Caldicoprobacter algeriensis]|uniref:motility associated factor glycosyltransferase family protein n=1 Tax=Caldicoprobacter algeriensis TaxID=699281 RepID=UPI00207A21EF|nr:6-hydroxymethylpterin diphosphokinase MptE-like protein [Caldicoprobacter algeriensis]MCM8900478.1 DUF115 domain-containing protein [Caldicoprobacter algeriensis]